jgi:hypothetical protein
MWVRLLHGAEHLSTQSWRGARYETRGLLRSGRVMTLAPPHIWQSVRASVRPAQHCRISMS